MAALNTHARPHGPAADVHVFKIVQVRSDETVGVMAGSTTKQHTAHHHNSRPARQPSISSRARLDMVVRASAPTLPRRSASSVACVRALRQRGVAHQCGRAQRTHSALAATPSSAAMRAGTRASGTRRSSPRAPPSASMENRPRGVRASVIDTSQGGIAARAHDTSLRASPFQGRCSSALSARRPRARRARRRPLNTTKHRPPRMDPLYHSVPASSGRYEVGGAGCVTALRAPWLARGARQGGAAHGRLRHVVDEFADALAASAGGQRFEVLTAWGATRWRARAVAWWRRAPRCWHLTRWRCCATCGPRRHGCTFSACPWAAWWRSDSRSRCWRRSRRLTHAASHHRRRCPASRRSRSPSPRAPTASRAPCRRCRRDCCAPRWRRCWCALALRRSSRGCCRAAFLRTCWPRSTRRRAAPPWARCGSAAGRRNTPSGSCFHDADACEEQASVAVRHHLPDGDIVALRDSGVPILLKTGSSRCPLPAGNGAARARARKRRCAAHGRCGRQRCLRRRNGAPFLRGAVITQCCIFS